LLYACGGNILTWNYIMPYYGNEAILFMGNVHNCGKCTVYRCKRAAALSGHFGSNY